MIKGVNKQIIEVVDFGNMYYEKALLFVKPEYAETQKDILEKEAKVFLKKLGKPASIKRKKHFFYWCLRLGLAYLLGSAVTVIIYSTQILS